MNDRPRFVFDANTLVSAALFHDSTPDKALRLALKSGQLLLSNDVIAELVEVLSRSKFDCYLTRDERDLFLTKLVQRGTLIEVTESVQACCDPDDDMYLALAVSGRAASIVSGDADLQSLGSYRGIPIRSPSEFVGSLPDDSSGI